jgi:adenosylhomocysteinase
MSTSFTNQCLAVLEIAKNKLENKVFTLPKKLDEEVARLHLDRLGIASKMTKLTKKQSEYIGVPVEGPYKSDLYRY